MSRPPSTLVAAQFSLKHAGLWFLILYSFSVNVFGVPRARGGMPVRRQVSLEDHEMSMRSRSVSMQSRSKSLDPSPSLASKDGDDLDAEAFADPDRKEKEDPWSQFRLERFFRSHRASSRSPAALAAAIEEHERDVFVAETRRLVVWHKLRGIQEDERRDLQRSLDALCRLGEQEQSVEQATGGQRFELPKEEGLRGLNMAAWHLPDEVTSETVKAMLEAFSRQKLPLHVASFRRILQMVRPLLEEQRGSVSYIPKGRRVTVVGDLHGKLRDLEKIFELNGWPRAGNVFVFNGDFVDRGPHSLEILAVLFALKVVHPDWVHLNRGNHEDVNIARANGFFEEIAAKYGSADLYLEICEVFRALPLCAVVEDYAFIVHGGLPREEAVRVRDIEQIERRRFRTTVTDMWWWEGTDDDDRTSRWRRSPRGVSVVEDLLWGDPHADLSDDATRATMLPNFSRGGGSSFGTENARRFLRREGLSVMIRSHQCVPRGYQRFDCGEGTALYTVFSASGYDGTDNDGAVLRLPADRSRSPYPVTYQAEEDSGLECHTKQYLVDQICQHKAQLRHHLLRAAWGRDARGLVSVEEWNAALQKCLRLQADFRPLRLELEGNAVGLVDVEGFLGRYGVEMVLQNGETVAVADGELKTAALFENRKELTTILRLLDANHDGRLSRDEVLKGCELLNAGRAPHAHVNGTFLFEQLDADGGEFISIEELCEGWRFTHTATADRARPGLVLPTRATVSSFLGAAALRLMDRLRGALAATTACTSSSPVPAVADGAEKS